MHARAGCANRLGVGHPVLQPRAVEKCWGKHQVPSSLPHKSRPTALMQRNTTRNAASARSTAVAEAHSGNGAGNGGAKKQAVVVGAGPAGALSALLLAKQGWKVDVYERAAPPLDAQGKAQVSIGPRSYSILLTERSHAALDLAGADLTAFDAPELGIALRHKLKGGPTEGQRSVFTGRHRVVNRGMLAAALVQLCQEQHSGSVAFHFNRALDSLDSQKGTAAFAEAAADGVSSSSSSSSRDGQRQLAAAAGASTAAGAAVGEEPATAAPPAATAAAATATAAAAASSSGLETVIFDLLVGADGSGSRVREELARQDSELRFSQQADLMEFKTFVLGAASDFLPEGATAAGSFQTWNNSKLNATVIGASTGDGQLRCTLVLPGGVHDTMKTAADYEAYMSKAFPSLPHEAVQRAAAQLEQCPVSNGGLLTRCTKLNSGRVVLVGDAGHSVYPALGQGANAALDGAAALAKTLQEFNASGSGNVEEAAAEYSRRWLPNAHAVVDLTEEAFGGNKRHYTLNLKLLQIISQMVLSKILPFVPKPALLQLNSSVVPYATVLERTKREMAVFKSVLAALGAAAVAGVAWALRARLGLGL